MSIARPNTMGLTNHRSTVMSAVRALCPTPNDAPASVVDIAAKTGLSHQCVRTHLARLTAEGVLVETAGVSARTDGGGRQPKVYRPARAAAS